MTSYPANLWGQLFPQRYEIWGSSFIPFSRNSTWSRLRRNFRRFFRDNFRPLNWTHTWNGQEAANVGTFRQCVSCQLGTNRQTVDSGMNIIFQSLHTSQFAMTWYSIDTWLQLIINYNIYNLVRLISISGKKVTCTRQFKSCSSCHFIYAKCIW